MGATDKNPGNFKNILSEGLALAGVNFESAILDKLVSHWELLSRWNRKINLTRITRAKDAVEKHYLDSLAMLPALGKAIRVLDIGSGAGFPGMVLAICRPDVEFHLVESVGKKAHFLMEARRSLSLDNITIHNTRAQKLAGDFYFDMATGRAAANPSDFIKMAAKLIMDNGRILLFSKGDISTEVRGVKQTNSIKYVLPFSGRKRQILVFEKA